MLKIFTTQLIGHFNRIQEQEEINLEDGARLLAQAMVGNGSVYIHGFGELQGVLAQALNSQEPFPNVKPLFREAGQLAALETTDRVLLFTHRSTDEEAIQLVKELSEKGIQTVGVSALVKNADESLEMYTDIHIDMKLKQPLVPGDDGTRYGYPALITALYTYHALYLTTKEITDEYIL